MNRARVKESNTITTIEKYINKLQDFRYIIHASF